MSMLTIQQVAERITQHAKTHALSEVDVILHGGEPLLAGADLLTYATDTIRSALSPGRATVTVQTNGTLLTRRILQEFRTHDVCVGVSLDGDQAAQDRHRRSANGRGSHASVARALKLLREEYRPLYRGLLCTIDLDNDPVHTYEALLEFAPPAVDFLLPHGNWTDLPSHYQPNNPENTPYADWLIAIFDRWYGTSRRETCVRMFDEIFSLILGGNSHSENIGLSPAALIVVDTDGSIQQVDTLKSTFPGAPDTHMTVADHSFDTVLWHPAIVARQIGAAALSETCHGCRVHRVCGAGNYAHRYRAGDGFRNPSVYCADLRRLIDHITGRVRSDLISLTEAQN
jgi:uncharacterized protein